MQNANISSNDNNDNNTITLQTGQDLLIKSPDGNYSCKIGFSQLADSKDKGKFMFYGQSDSYVFQPWSDDADKISAGNTINPTQYQDSGIGSNK